MSTDAGALADELDALIARPWLDAWEEFEGAATGFLDDLLCAWQRTDPALLVRHARFRALYDLLLSHEDSFSATTRAAFVRAGLRSHRAAIASVLAIPLSDRRASIEALLGLLDAGGVHALLAGIKGMEYPPRVAIARRLVALGDIAAAQAWLVGASGDPGAIRRIAEAIDVFPPDAQARLRNTAWVLSHSPFPDDDAAGGEPFRSAAPLFEGARADAMLDLLTIA